MSVRPSVHWSHCEDDLSKDEKMQLFMMILRIIMIKMILLIIMILKSMTAQIYRGLRRLC